MRAIEFQQNALDRLDLYLQKLIEAQAQSDKQAKYILENPGTGFEAQDFTNQAWEKMAAIGEVGRAEPYSPRKDGTDSPVPCITLKVPTGGGKTYLAVCSVAKILDQYFADDTEKFVLWIVPSEAIYRQTKEKLIDRDHTFRQLLDIVEAQKKISQLWDEIEIVIDTDKSVDEIYQRVTEEELRCDKLLEDVEVDDE